MAQSSASLPERLETAYIYHASHVREDDIPQGYRHEFRELQHMLTHRPARYEGEGTVQATTAQMAASEADEAARLLVKLFDHVLSAYRP